MSGLLPQPSDGDTRFIQADCRPEAAGFGQAAAWWAQWAVPRLRGVTTVHIDVDAGGAVVGRVGTQRVWGTMTAST